MNTHTFNKLQIFPIAVIAATLAACGTSTDAGKAGTPPADPPGLDIVCAARASEAVRGMSDDRIALTSARGLPNGRYALPADPAPTQLVVMFHGHGNDSCSWRDHLRAVADRGAIAIAMDYTGQHDTVDVENYGWFARAGAADSIAAAQYFLEQYPSIKSVYAFGVSMGGNMSGVAVASADARRADGSPLFDYWVAVEGVHDLIQEYLIARALAPSSSFIAQAQHEIEEENGGPLEEQYENYAEITNVLHAREMAYLKAAVFVHGVDDGLVPTWMSREMAEALNTQQVPTRLVTVVLRGDGEDGTTATGIPLGPIAGGAGQTYTSPFAGHGWEGSSTQLVMRSGLDELFKLMAAAPFVPGEKVVDGL